LKPRPQYDFPLSVHWRSSDVDPDSAAFYGGILEFLLNFTITIRFVPRYERGAHRVVPVTATV
jgi:hypothetical protein